MKPHVKSMIAALLVGSFGLSGCDLVGDMTVDEVIEAARDAVENRERDESPESPDSGEEEPIEPGEEEPIEPGEEEPLEPGDEDPLEPGEEEPFEPGEEEPLEPGDDVEEACIAEFEACMASLVGDEGLPGDEEEEGDFEGDEGEDCPEGGEDGDEPLDAESEDIGDLPPEDEDPLDPGAEDIHNPAEVCFAILEQCEFHEPEDDICDARYEEAAVCGEDLDACVAAVDAELENQAPVEPRPEDDEDGEVEPQDPYAACFETFESCEAEILGEECSAEPEPPIEDDPVLEQCDAELDLCLDGLRFDEEGEEAEVDECFEVYEACVSSGVEDDGEEPAEPLPPEAE